MLGQPLRRRPPPRAVRGRHRGDQRGRRLQRHRARPPTGRAPRAYLLQTAEKGIAWLRLHAHGRAGHGSVPNDENAVVRLAEAIARIDAHEWPREYIASVRELLDGLSALTGDRLCRRRPRRRCSPTSAGRRASCAGTLQDTANFTMLDAGYKHNVIPQTRLRRRWTAASCPATRTSCMATIRELAGEHVEVEVVHRDIALDAPFGRRPRRGDEGGAARARTPGAAVLPYCLSGGTDNKALSRLGITGYGFAPLRLPADLDFAPMFHGIDERVPVDSLRFGTRVLSASSHLLRCRTTRWSGGRPRWPVRRCAGRG